jgi:GWxTD domain-containing protein
MRYAIKYISGFTIILLLWGCRSLSNLAVHNFAGQYIETDEQGMPDIVPFVLTDSITKIYFRIPYSTFLYKTAGKEKIRSAAFNLHFDLFTNYESQKVIDSGTFVFADSLYSGSGGMFNFEFDTRAAEGQNYLLSLTINDLNNKTFRNGTCYINRIAKSSSSSFKVNQEGEGILYTSVLLNKQPLVVSTADTSMKSLWVSVFRRKFQLPAPPFSQDERPQFDYNPDSIFRLTLQKGATGALTLNKPGFYYFRSDTALLEGFTLFRFSEGFPKLVNARQMLGALRYITSAKEFEAISQRPDTRSAVDSFWLATGGNADRAVNLIRDYYSRVQRANELFSSFTEGWQTDRGLIYIILGPPNVVYRSNLQEEWVYGEAGNMHSLYFYFAKVVNPFTNADYVLMRDPIMKQAWYMAVERWRR